MAELTCEWEIRIPPSVRLMGIIEAKREATEEVAMWQKHVEFFRETKGYQIMWKNMRTVREIYFDSFEPVLLGNMTRDLWKD